MPGCLLCSMVAAVASGGIVVPTAALSSGRAQPDFVNRLLNAFDWPALPDWMTETNWSSVMPKRVALEGIPEASHFWPIKGGNLNRTGATRSIGSFRFSTPAWTWEEPDRAQKGKSVPTMKVFHSTPVIDGDYNVYVQSTTGWVYSLTPTGQLRWSFETTDANPGNLALLDDTVYTISQDGMAFAIYTANGREKWRSQAALTGPEETHSLVAVESTVLMACNPTRENRLGNEAVCALSTTDGSPKWTYSLLERSGEIGHSLMPAVVEDTVLFNDATGGLYRVSLGDGWEMWYTPGVPGAQFSHGGLAVGPNGRVYNTFNKKAGMGMLRVHDFQSGAVVWSRTFHEEVNAAPAVGRLKAGGPLAVVVAVGDNLQCTPLSAVERAQMKAQQLKHTAPQKHAVVFALDAESAEKIWHFAAPPYNQPCAGTSWDNICCPDVWGAPTIGGDGTVYVNWSGGYSYGLRDSTGDGQVSGTPKDKVSEVTSFFHGSGSNGNTAISPSLIVVPSCNKILAYTGRYKGTGGPKISLYRRQPGQLSFR